ncbi:hypothetical protein [Streptomyces sp. NPDC042319]|uniref:hypothetical protein n=1 Tax=Streptomyces sp. NPDC042319 TaxID=3154332 RepID=UPI00340DACE5
MGMTDIARTSAEVARFDARLLISPSFGSKEARQHWADTLDQSVCFSEERYAEHLTPDQLGLLHTLHPDGTARFWGAAPRHDSRMARVTTGDVVLFTGGNRVRAAGEVGALFRNRAFADALWPPGPDGKSWHTVYSLRDFQLTDVPYEELNALLGYKADFKYPGQLVLSGERAKAGMDGLLITTRTSLEKAGAAAPVATVRSMPVEQQHTHSVTVQLGERRMLVRRDEAALVIAYRATLLNAQAERFSSPAGICDLYVDGPEGREIVEAKSRAEHPYIRAALAQLLDYARHAPHPLVRLSVLLPSRPAQESLNLLHHYGVDSIHREEGGTFQRLTAPEARRRTLRDVWSS